MTPQANHPGPLDAAAIERFVRQGVVRLDAAFPRDLAEEGRALLWRQTGCDPDDPARWTRPVIRLGYQDGPPFAAAATAPRLTAAFDQLVGAGNWLPRTDLGTFPVRFPAPDDPGDTGWHVDPSFHLPEDDPGDFLGWRVNRVSRGRALLLLCLFSDVGLEDAPTRLRLGSHRDLARRLDPLGETGASLRDLAANGFAESAARPEAAATGPAGTVYLCHPFLVHAGQRHRGRVPRFMAQPPLLPRRPFRLDRADPVPVERAILEALSGEA